MAIFTFIHAHPHSNIINISVIHKLTFGHSLTHTQAKEFWNAVKLQFQVYFTDFSFDYFFNNSHFSHLNQVEKEQQRNSKFHIAFFQFLIFFFMTRFSWKKKINALSFLALTYYRICVVGKSLDCFFLQNKIQFF